MKLARFWVVWLALLSLLLPTVVSAHGIVAGGAQVLVADAGPHQLRIEAIVPTGAPTKLLLRIAVTSPLRSGATVSIAAAPLGMEPTVTQALPFAAEPYPLVSAEIPITQIGAWDIALTVSDGGGQSGVFVLPVTIQDTSVPPTTLPMFAAFAVMALVLALQVLWPAAPAWTGLLSRTVLISALTVIAALGSLIVLPQVRFEWNTAMPAPMPFFTATQSTTASEILFRFHDGSTGLPVDDFVPHHQALVHTVCIEQRTARLVHVHPARIAVGTYALDRSLLPGGTYDCTHEAERLMTGAQIARTQVVLPGSPIEALPFGVLGATKHRDGFAATVTSDQPVRVGVPSSLTVRFDGVDGPVSSIMPWLGMRGHLIVRNKEAGVFGHVHAVGPMDDRFDVTAVPGDSVSFVYAFPVAGTYELWFQAQIGTQIVTVPVHIVVTEGA